MTSPIEDKKPADDGVLADDDVSLTAGEGEGGGEAKDEGADAPASFTMLGGAGEACGPDGCCST